MEKRNISLEDDFPCTKDILATKLYLKQKEGKYDYKYYKEK